MPIVAWIFTALAAAAMIAIVAWWIYRKVRGADRPDFSVLGMRVYSSQWSIGKTDVKMPLPQKARLQEFLWANVEVVRAALVKAGAKTQDCALSRLVLYWQPVRRVRRVSGGFERTESDDHRLMFLDPKDRPVYRGHDWYAGRRIGNCVKVGWTGTIPATALLHEIGHALRERNGLDPDPSHADREFWRVVG